MLSFRRNDNLKRQLKHLEAKRTQNALDAEIANVVKRCM